MYVRFWGARGSMPKPGPETLRYGGNTSCLEVCSASGTLIVIDGGSGLHALGQALRDRPIAGGHILISHTHWDHIQGIPFFAPFFTPGQQWHIYAPRGFGQSLQETLAAQMQYSFFPVRLDQMAANIRFHELTEGSFEIDDVRISTRYMNHTALTLGFRLEADGASVVYASDHEPYIRRMATGEGEIIGRDRQHCAFLEDADLVIHDAQFTAEEYPDRAGWGHSTVEYAVAVARAAGARRLALTHHDPMRSDCALDELVAAARNRQPADVWSLDIFAAAEGQIVELQGGAPKGPKEPAQSSSISAAPVHAGAFLILGALDPNHAQVIREAARLDDIAIAEADDAASAMRIATKCQPSVAVLDLRDARLGAFGRQSDLDLAGTKAGLPRIYVGDCESCASSIAERTADGADILVAPFSLAQVRTVIRAAVLRALSR